MTPPRECPCGRPRSGGTVLEVLGFRGEPVRVLFLHPDGQCEWGRHRGPGPSYWSHVFTAVAA